MSLQSMLTGNDKNERPEGDAGFVANNRQRPRDINFYYHDDTVWGIFAVREAKHESEK